jgi:UDP-N-acetylmuramoyl-L-alanyl-D-glutamate--2,6-diaminopimelate ligase
VGVTGTNGKTTTTSLVAAALSCLSAPIPRVTTIGFFVGEEKLELAGDYRGFLRTLKLGRERGARHAAIELTSQALGLGFFNAWPCKIGVFTNLTRDHVDQHGSPEHYLASKAQLFVNLPPGGSAILNGCDPASQLLAEVIPEGVRVLYYGARSRGEPLVPLDLEAEEVELSWQGTRAGLKGSARLGPIPQALELRAIGDVFVENGLAALCAAVAMGAPASAAAAAMAEAPAPSGRFEVVRREPYVVVDYAHTPDALRRTLGAARQLCRGRLAVVFGAGGDRDQPKRPMMGEAASGADQVWLTSDNPRSENPLSIAEAIRGGLADHPNVTIELDREVAITRAIRAAQAEDVVLIAGKGHEAEQDVAGTRRHFSDAEVARRA